MRTEHLSEHDPRVQRAVEELKHLVRDRFPGATFTVTPGEDPEGIYLSPTIDVEDTDEVMNVVLDRLLELQIDQELPVYVVPTLPLERVAQQLKGQMKRTLPPTPSSVLHP